ncbi:MAG: YncE family protein [Candidatus Sericytochromatia bacterium]|nr:YncE family protein [Candidatus Tanganyikabacteria bacterium]
MRHGFLPATAAAIALSGCPVPAPADLAPRELVADRTLPTGKGPHGIAVAAGVVVQANPAGGTIDLFDAEKETLIKTLTPADLGTLVGGVATASPGLTKATPDGTYALTADPAIPGVRVLKPGEARQVATVDIGPLKPSSRIVWADATTAYLSVTSEGGGVNALKLAWKNGFEAPPEKEPLAITRAGVDKGAGGSIGLGAGFLALANGTDNSVSFVSLAAPAAITSLQLGNNPGPVDIVNPAGRPLLVFGNRNSNTVVVYDLQSRATIATLPVGTTPTDMVARPDGRYVYGTCRGAANVCVIDTVAGKVHGEIRVGLGLADKPASPVHIYHAEGQEGSHQAWVGNDGDASVTIIDMQANRAIAVVKTGAGHHKMAFTPTKAFVSNLTDSTLSVIDRKALY